MLKEITEYLGLELSDDSSLDDFKNQFNTKFYHKDSVPDDVHKSIVGKLNGEFENKIKKAFPDLKEVEASNLELIDLASQKTTDKITELQTQFKEGSDKNLQKAIEENSKLKSRVQEYESGLNEVQSEYESYKQETESKFQNLDRSYYMKDLYSDAPFSDTADEYWRTGFKNQFQSKYNFEKIEDQYWPTRDGKRISNPNQAGSFLTGSEVLKMELEQAGKAKVNNVQPQPETKYKRESKETSFIPPARSISVIN